MKRIKYHLRNAEEGLERAKELQLRAEYLRGRMDAAFEILCSKIEREQRPDNKNSLSEIVGSGSILDYYLK